LVTGLAAAILVVSRQAVEIAADQARRLPVAPGHLADLLGQQQEPALVAEAGQLVVERESLELVFRARKLRGALGQTLLEVTADRLATPRVIRVFG
jgi:hypothetical protein